MKTSNNTGQKYAHYYACTILKRKIRKISQKLMIHLLYRELKIKEKDIEDEKNTKAGNRVEVDESKDIV